jgi:hypothetical protein
VVDVVQVTGNSSTAERTLLLLLPRQPPAQYSAVELLEFERRLNNLGIFDRVLVGCAGRRLEIDVREKWTLVPEVDFASGETWEDSYALLGATEYNLFGTANQLSVSAYRERRGFGFSVAFSEHDYQRHSWALGSNFSVSSAAVTFDDDSGWHTTSISWESFARSPPLLTQYFNYVAGLYLSSESVHGVERAVAPPSTRVVQTFMGFSWDAYQWHDLVPHGFRASLWLSTGGLFGVDPPQPRHTVELSVHAALRLAEHTALVTRLEGVLGTRGNVNYGFLLGSLAGVRGLPDARYFDWAHAFVNLELRQSFLPLERWAFQLVAFSDAAAFEPMTASGGRGEADIAFCAGLGARVVPTWISSVALRLDAARLVAPERAWFAQFGLKQYF